VDIPGHGQSKINDAYSLGGPALTVDTVKKLTGLDINFIAVVDFKGFREIVDTFGGVWIDVDRRYFNDNSQGENYATIDIEPGYQLLGGRDALDFARFRHTDSDFHRIARQQQMLASLKKQAGKSEVVKNIPGLFGTLKRNTDMATGGNGTVPARVIIDYMRLALTLNPDAIKQVELECGIDMTAAGASIVVCGQDTIDAAVDAFLDPSDTAKQQAIANLTGEKAAPANTRSPKSVPPKGLTVEVKNGNGVPGAATSAATDLRKLGYTVQLQPGTAGNADRQDYTNTQVQYSDPKWESAANILAESIPGAEVTQLQDPTATKAGILVIVGQEDDISTAGPNGVETGAESAPDSAKVPEKSKPKVVTDPEYGLAEMQAMQAESGIRMPLMYPTARESSTTYPDPPRAYKIRKGKAVYDAYRLVGRTAGSDYWGVQGTMWPDPPILDDPSREIVRNGRTYLLFFNGTRLHRVAWREDGGVYWVSNSVLDKLSNETMLAIAEGVKPVPK
jgi:LCP family protein required for cell wall assembly